MSAKAGVGFAESLLSENQLAPYAVRAVAKAFLTDNSPKKALEVIARIESENIAHWLLYRKAEAQLAIDDNNGALKSANVALKLAENDPKAKDRISIYHDLLSKCYEQLKENTNALSELGIAIKKCTDSRYKQELKNALNILKH
ncbi:MAG: hypothetical protein GX325_06425 [Peptococcaceae bacterium]|nr:hypothetical protein [Peptococcaceae bacterium]